MNKFKTYLLLTLLACLSMACEESENDMEQEDSSCSFEIVNENASFLNRDNHSSVFFQNKFWVVGGEKEVSGEFPQLTNDVWYSEDGVNWNLATDNAQFEQRWKSEMIVFDNKMWLFGGFGYLDGTTSPFKVLTDVWNSVDGITWNLVETNLPSNVTIGNIVVHNNRIFNLYQSDNSLLGVEVFNWYSDDGIIWNSIELSDNYPKKSFRTATSFNGKIWLIGGRGLPTPNDVLIVSWNDVWSSSDAVNWNQEVTSAEFSIRHNHRVAVYNNKLWLSGGDSTDTVDSKSDVWYSDDGITWNLECDEAFIGRSEHTMISSNNKLFVIGGSDGGFSFADVLSFQ